MRSPLTHRRMARPHETDDFPTARGPMMIATSPTEHSGSSWVSGVLEAVVTRVAAARARPTGSRPVVSIMVVTKGASARPLIMITASSAASEGHPRATRQTLPERRFVEGEMAERDIGVDCRLGKVMPVLRVDHTGDDEHLGAGGAVFPHHAGGVVDLEPVTARVGIRRRLQHAYLVDVEIPNTKPLIGEIAEDLLVRPLPVAGAPHNHNTGSREFVTMTTPWHSPFLDPRPIIPAARVRHSHVSFNKMAMSDVLNSASARTAVRVPAVQAMAPTARIYASDPRGIPSVASRSSWNWIHTVWHESSSGASTQRRWPASTLAKAEE